MNLKAMMFVAVLAVPLFSNAQDIDMSELTGDPKLACEAMLCLSSGTRPSECQPSLKKYFSITHRKLSRQIQKRRAFLDKCPLVDEDQAMKKLKGEIATGAGRCDAPFLNGNNREIVSVYICVIDAWGNRTRNYMTNQPNLECTQGDISVVSQTLPAYCVTYINHQYTNQLDVRYVGEKINGGHWVPTQQ